MRWSLHTGRATSASRDTGFDSFDTIAARYEPDAWACALDVQRSKLAVPLEAILSTAQEAIPALIHEEMFWERL